jgi:hypothetical protein
MDRNHEIIINIVMLVTLGQTLFITDVIGIEAADDELFIFSNRKERIVRAQIDTSTEQNEQTNKQRELAQWSLLFGKAESCRSNKKRFQ